MFNQFLEEAIKKLKDSLSGGDEEKQAENGDDYGNEETGLDWLAVRLVWLVGQVYSESNRFSMKLDI